MGQVLRQGSGRPPITKDVPASVIVIVRPNRLLISAPGMLANAPTCSTSSFIKQRVPDTLLW